jgi:DNA-binding XRE family transcriptional regulator
LIKFKNEDFENLCINFWAYSKAHKALAPKPPSPFLNVMMRGALAGDSVDRPLNPMFSAFVLSLNDLPEHRQIAFYATWICSAYRNGKKVPIKVLASELGVTKTTFYRWANEDAKEVWRQTLKLTQLSQSLKREIEDSFD